MSSQEKNKNNLGWIPTVLVLASLLFVFVSQRVVNEGTWERINSGLGSAALMLALLFRFNLLNQAVGAAKLVEKRLLAATLGIGLGLLVYLFATDTGLDWLGLKQDGRDKVEAILWGLWPSILLVSLTTLLFIEAVYRKMPVAEAVEIRRVQIAVYSGMGLALAIVFLATANYVAFKRDIRKDLSYFKTTKPSEVTHKMIRKLGEPIRVVIFYDKGSDLLPQVEPYFREIAKSSSGKLKVEVVDHALAPKLAREQRVQDNGNVLLMRGKGSGPNVQTEQLAIGNDLEAARPKLRTLDATFQEKLNKLTKPPRTFYLTVGHGERNANDREGYNSGDATANMKAALGQLNIQTGTLGLSSGLASQVPLGVGAVAVIGPKTPFLKEEAESLLRYARNGGRIILMLDPDIDVGLTPLLEGLGVRMLPGVDASENFHLAHTRQPSDKTIVFSKEYSSHPSVTTASRFAQELATVFINGGALQQVPEADKLTPKPQISFPLKTPSGFWRDLNGNFERDASEPIEALNLIAAITVPGATDKEGRIVVIADGDFVTDKVFANKGNLLPFIDSLRWMVGEEDLAGNISSEEDVKIEHRKDEDKLWFYSTTFGAPAIVAGFGMWMMRRRRKHAKAS